MTSWSGAVAPHMSLMLNPSGETPIGTTSAPSSWNTWGPTWYAAPWAQSTTIFIPLRSSSAGKVDLQNSMYRPEASSMRFARPSCAAELQPMVNSRAFSISASKSSGSLNPSPEKNLMPLSG